MAAISVATNSIILATISTEAKNIVSVHIHGDTIGPELAHINATGGNYEGASNSDHRIFIADYEITESHRIEISFSEGVLDFPLGKTIDDFYSDDEPEFGPWQPESEIWEFLRHKPKVRDGFKLELVKPNGEIVSVQTAPGSYSFGLSVGWNWKRPDTARISLTSASIDAIENRRGSTDHASFRIKLGQSICFFVNPF